MKTFFALATCLIVLSSCTGSYQTSKCEGRQRSLRGIEGSYNFVVDGENQGFIFKVVRNGVGAYSLVANGESAAELITCVIDRKEFLELISPEAVIPFTRTNRTITSVDFDTAVLDAEGVTYESAPIPDWGLTLISLTSVISDGVLIRAAKPGLMTFVKR